MIMKNKILASLFATATLLSFGSVASASSIKEVVDATYKLYFDNVPICSGQFIKSTDKEDLFLTAGHCIAHASTDKMKDFNIRKTVLDEKFNVISEHTYWLKPVRTMMKKDVVLMQTTDPSGEFATVDIAGVEEANKVLEIGAPVVAVGYPKMMEITYTHGEFTGKVKFPDDGNRYESPFYRTTVPVTGGSSGGGLYIKDGNEYKLVGATTAGWPDVSFMNYFSTVEAINEIVKGFNLDEKVTVGAKDLPLKGPEVTPIMPSPDSMEK